MLIQGVSVSVIYKRIEGIKKGYYDNASIFKTLFYDATSLAIPDDAPVEIPRIIIKTLDDLGEVSITPVTTTFTARFDRSNMADWGECKNYIQKHMAVVFKFLHDFTDGVYDFIGVLANISCNEVAQNTTKKLSFNLLKNGEIDNLFDVAIKYTFVEEDNFYVNIRLQNGRKFQSGLNNTRAGDFCRENQIGEFIEVVIDINDRYGFYNNKDYHSTIHNLPKILEMTTNIIENKLSKLIEHGEY